MEDKKYCSSSYLMYRTISDRSKSFSDKFPPIIFSNKPVSERAQIHNSYDLEESIRGTVEKMCAGKKTAIALSGGIDSAILAKFMPKGSVAYTFKCVVPGRDVVDETAGAAKYAAECGLEHRIVEIYWEDYEKYAPILMKHKGAPIHSIEVQIYKAGLQALEDGHEAIVYGESCDVNYGGFNGLLSRDWTVGEFIDRYACVRPYYALKDFEMVTEPVARFEKNGIVDVHEFCRKIFLEESMGSYTNANQTAGITFCAPFSETYLAEPLDIERVRRGENKYLVREVFNRLYPGYIAPPKTPMPRATDEWLAEWGGPTRPEFWPNCTKNMTGDQKFYIWALEKFLTIIEEQDR